MKLLTLLLMKKGSNDLAVNTQSTIHQWGMPWTQIAPNIVNKVQNVNMSSFVTSTWHSEPKGSSIESRIEMALKNDSSCVLWSSTHFASQSS
ncbi:hypothetical protein DPMN_005822 [Dreissena polymorpha]|uniref:Uncharacterized protein n=1 Tax=Dreissena polymorpha TaxID=45954 RepID=A0A9D4RWV4_DREPO|nr:hypothetical protein DPMN_005822 [Dreissena polymorpha]